VSALPRPAELFGAYYGMLVTGGPKTLPASTTGHIFTVSGGRVIVTTLTGVVTTNIQSQTTTLSVGNTPTGGSASTTSFCTALDLTGKAAGVSLAVPQAKTSALLASGADGTLLWSTSAGAQGILISNGGLLLVPAGTIDVTTAATSTGAIQWSVTYVPYDAGATITAL
jgi:hypothetical protein